MQIVLALSSLAVFDFTAYEEAWVSSIGLERNVDVGERI
jgi:hypothetical protein